MIGETLFFNVYDPLYDPQNPRMTPKIRLGLTALGTIRQYCRSLKKPQILDFLRIWGFSAPTGTRTPDTRLKRAVLYLLSYWGK